MGSEGNDMVFRVTSGVSGYQLHVEPQEYNWTGLGGIRQGELEVKKENLPEGP